jgi:hypothetical protein
LEFEMADFNVDKPTGGDDRALIQAAIDKAMKAGGGVVRLGEGDYKVGFASYNDGKGDSVIVPSNVQLIGVGADKTKLTYIGEKDVTAVIRTPSKGKYVDASGNVSNLNAYGAQDVVFEGFTVDGGGNGKAKSGIYVGQTPAEGVDKSSPELVEALIASGKADKNITIKGVVATGAYHAGLNIHELTTNLNMSNVVSHGNRSKGAKNDADGIILDGVHHSKVSGVTVYNNDRHGLNVVSGSHDVVIDGVKSTKNGVDGVVVQTPKEFPTQTTDIELRNIVSTENGGKDIRVTRAGNVTRDGQKLAMLDDAMERALAQAADASYRPQGAENQPAAPVTLAAAPSIGGRSA